MFDEISFICEIGFTVRCLITDGTAQNTRKWNTRAKPQNKLGQRPHPNLRPPRCTRPTHGRLPRQQA